MEASHAAGWPSDSPTPAQLKEFFAQVAAGRVTRIRLQALLRGEEIIENIGLRVDHNGGQWRAIDRSRYNRVENVEGFDFRARGSGIRLMKFRRFSFHRVIARDEVSGLLSAEGYRSPDRAEAETAFRSGLFPLVDERPIVAMTGATLKCLGGHSDTAVILHPHGIDLVSFWYESRWQENVQFLAVSETAQLCD